MKGGWLQRRLPQRRAICIELTVQTYHASVLTKENGRGNGSELRDFYVEPKGVFTHALMGLTIFMQRGWPNTLPLPRALAGDRRLALVLSSTVFEPGP